MLIRPFQSSDQSAVLDLWHCCGLVVPQNAPVADIHRKMRHDPQGFLVGLIDGKVVGTVMAGYDGHRGWINYLAVQPDMHNTGLGRQLMAAAEQRLRQLRCPKINLQIRTTNTNVIAFYQALGFREDAVVSMGKRLEHDQE